MVTVGSAVVCAIEESVQPSFVPHELLPDCDADALARHMHWLDPLHYDCNTGRFRTSVRSYLVKTGRHTVLIDACGGNHKNRPYFPRFHRREHAWLERLAAAGVAPEQIDYVMCTHLHADHVGWNTVWRDGRWQPTFANAKYLAHRDEFARWNPASPSYRFSPHNEFTWEDSILPVVETGQALPVDDGYVIDESLTVELTPGHTLAHIAMHLRSQEQHAVFSGDVMHVPLQVYYPHWSTSLDDDPQLGVRSRLRLLQSCAESGSLVLPTHFVPADGCFITRAGEGFGIVWNQGKE